MLKSLALLILFALLSFGAHAQTTFPEVSKGNDASIPEKMRGRYWRHAAEIAWRWLAETNSPDTASVVLPEKLVNSLYNALVHVHTAKGTPERDSALTCDIRPYPMSFYWVSDLTINLKQAPWAKAWQKKKVLTGNAEIDRIMKKYSLTPHVQTASRKELAVDFSTENAAQMWKIEQELLRVKGISRKEEDFAMAMGDEGSIRASTEGNSWVLAYRCGTMNDFNEWRISEITWYFKVGPDGTVEYEGREGELRSME